MVQTPGAERTSTQHDFRLAVADSSVVMLGIAVLGLGLGIILNAHGLHCAAAICPSFCRFGGVFDGGYGQRWRTPSVDCVDGVPRECTPSGVRSFLPVAQCEGFLG